MQALEGDPQARAKAEEQVRQKWLGVLVQVLKSLEAPSVRKAAASKHAAELIGLQVGTQRARTLRLRVRSWCSMRAWLRSAYGIGHPREAHHFLDYMMDKRAEPCSRGTLQQILSTLRFAEKAIGLQMENRISEDVYLKTAAAGIINATASRAGHKARGPAQSPMMWCIVGLERMVMNGDGDVYGRMLAWWLLVSSWSVLRFDDHRGLASSGICQGALGVSLQFDRTKTTGCDKSVSTRPGLVAWGAWMVEEHWLRTGASLWEEHAPWPRDYFLTQPGRDTVCRPRELGYTEYAGRMRALISNLTVSGYGEAGAAVASFWQPHSWRAFLPSATGAIGAPSELLKWIAAWTAKSGDAYVRTHKEKTQVLQCTCARIMRAYLGADDPLGEHESADKLRRHLEDRGVAAEEVDKIIEGVRMYPRGRRRVKQEQSQTSAIEYTGIPTRKNRSRKWVSMWCLFLGEVEGGDCTKWGCASGSRASTTNGSSRSAPACRHQRSTMISVETAGSSLSLRHPRRERTRIRTPRTRRTPVGPAVRLPPRLPHQRKRGVRSGICSGREWLTTPLYDAQKTVQACDECRGTGCLAI